MNRTQMLRLLKQGKDPLDLSIQKWQDIVDGKGENCGTSNCALCERHQHDFDCGECPVAKETGQDFCEDTPYAEIEHKPGKIPKDLAQKELSFLKSLKREA